MAWYERTDANHDQSLSMKEWQAVFRDSGVSALELKDLFVELDADGNGALSLTEVLLGQCRANGATVTRSNYVIAAL